MIWRAAFGWRRRLAPSSIDAGRRPGEEESLFSFVAGDGSGALELPLGFSQPAGPVQEIRSCGRQRGIIAQGSMLRDLVDQLRPASGPKAML